MTQGAFGLGIGSVQLFEYSGNPFLPESLREPRLSGHGFAHYSTHDRAIELMGLTSGTLSSKYRFCMGLLEK